MGRKALPTAATLQDSIPPGMTAALESTQQIAASLEHAFSQEQAIAIETLTKSRIHHAYENFSRINRILEMRKVKESKAYRVLKGQISRTGSEILRGTWEEYCALMDISVDKADIDIKNLNEFGSDALECMETAGMGYRQLNQLRKLPEDEKSALIEVAKAGDKEALVEFAETILEKHAKEKTELAKKVEELTADSESKEQVIADKDKKINEQAKKLTRIRRQPLDQTIADMRTDISTLVNTIDHDMRVNFCDAMNALREESGDSQDDFIKAQLELLQSTIHFIQEELQVEWVA